MSSECRPDAVAVVVVRGENDETRLLVVRRARGVFAGAWTFVMGTVEADERATEAVRRELLEETGLTAEVVYTAGELDAFFDPVSDRIVHVPFFVVRVSGGGGAHVEVVLEADVHDAFRWVTFAEAADMLEFAAQRRVLDEIHRAFVVRAPQPWRVIP